MFMYQMIQELLQNNTGGGNIRILPTVLRDSPRFYSTIPHPANCDLNVLHFLFFELSYFSNYCVYTSLRREKETEV